MTNLGKQKKGYEIICTSKYQVERFHVKFVCIVLILTGPSCELRMSGTQANQMTWWKKDSLLDHKCVSVGS